MSEIKNRKTVVELSKVLKEMGHEIIREEFTEEGFYCDFYSKQTISANDLPSILSKLPNYTTLTSVSGLNLEALAQRIHGSSFDTEEELEAFIKMNAELSELDHRHLGSSLGLFKIDPDICPGMVVWLPRGVVVLEKIKTLIRNNMKKNGYKEVVTPQLADLNLWKKSGHWEMYRDHMFIAKGGDDGSTYALKPMSCPLHIEIFKNFHLSYKDLPYKLAEFGGCTRYEPSGSLHGLFRVRAFTQDDAHVFCSEGQILSTILEFIHILQEIYSAFGFECVKVCLATRPDEFAGTIENWDRAEKALEEAAKEAKVELTMNPGDGAFYGPKLEFYLEDSRKRVWQCGTVQVDFVLPNRLEATYITAENTKEYPVIIHHAVLGTIERFLGILLEHTKGHLPFWLCPLQVIIIPIHEDHLIYSKQLQKTLSSEGVISEIDASQDTLGYKIRKWWTQNKIPVIVVLGDKEMQNGTVSIRIHGKDIYNGLTIEEFLVKMKDMGKILE